MSLSVENQSDRSHYALLQDGELIGVADTAARRCDRVHSHRVDEAKREKGMASTLVRTALDDVRDHSGRRWSPAAPTCGAGSAITPTTRTCRRASRGRLRSARARHRRPDLRHQVEASSAHPPSRRHHSHPGSGAGAGSSGLQLPSTCLCFMAGGRGRLRRATRRARPLMVPEPRWALFERSIQPASPRPRSRATNPPRSSTTHRFARFRVAEDLWRACGAPRSGPTVLIRGRTRD